MKASSINSRWESNCISCLNIDILLFVFIVNQENQNALLPYLWKIAISKNKDPSQRLYTKVYIFAATKQILEL